MTDDLKRIWAKLHSDVPAASYPTLFDTYTQRGYELDHMSILDWIEESVPGGTSSRLGQLLDVAYNIEYGAESSVQSSLNLLYLLGYVGPGQLRVFGKSDEKYHVRGGNDQVPSRLATALEGQITTGSELVAVKRTAAGAYTLTFKQGSKAKTVAADKVVLALPFSIVRRSVDVSQAGFSDRKLQAIAEMGMGTNSKLHVQFRRRHWNELGSNGETYSDRGYQSSWSLKRAARAVRSRRSHGRHLIGELRLGDAATGHSNSSADRAVLLGSRSTGTAGRRSTTDRLRVDASSYYWEVGQYTGFSGIEGRQRERPLASTRRSTSRAISAPSRPASGRRAR